MKILIDLTSLYDHLTGIERFASNLSACLIRAHTEHSYELLFKNEVHKDFREICELPNVHSRVIRCRSRVLFNQFMLPLKLYQTRSDLYFFPAFCAPWLFFSRRIVDTIHDMSDFECFEGKAFLKVIYSRLGIIHAKHCSRHIITVSEFSRGRIAELLGIDKSRISVISNGISKEFARGELRHDDRNKQGVCDRKIMDKYHLPEKYILSVSTLEPRKNIRLLIKAYLRIKDEFPDIDLVLCGRSGWNLREVLGENVSDMSEGHDILLQNRVHITGFVDDEDLPELYAGAEWFVFPSKYEGFGIPPLEAMGTGCPVISSDAASLPEVLGDAAVYFENNSVDSLTEKLRHAIEMPKGEKEELIRKGLRQAEKYSWEDSARKLENLLKGIFSAAAAYRL